MIKINLKTALTKEAIDKALPHIGACHYSSPCIIGACMTDAERDELVYDGKEIMRKIEETGSYTDLAQVDLLVAEKFLEFPDFRQRKIASDLQYAFDNKKRDEFINTLHHAQVELGLEQYP